MTMFARLFLSGFCLLLAHSSGVAQQSRTLDPAAPLPETLEWLKANIPYNYTQPRNSERKELTREAITHVRTKGCTMNYEITSEPLEGAATRDHANGDLEQNEWRIELGRLNSRLVRLEAAQPDRAARILFASFDPGDPEVASKLKQSEPTIFLNYSNKAIWHSSRMGARRIREEFVSWGTIPVKNETLGAQIVAALVHAVDLCRQLTPAPAGP